MLILTYNYISYNNGQYNSYRSLLPTLTYSDHHYYSIFSDFIHINIENANEISICKYERSDLPSNNIVEVSIPHTNNTNNGVYFGLVSNINTENNNGREIISHHCIENEPITITYYCNGSPVCLFLHLLI